ncbi:hypothetical protein ACH5RR_013916 [Cinchona calisaya]|uniref:Hydroxyproline-rich glycoprotein family protein n=1 Tax=Cinchona calisaya TaxID=153742 RepID=A0ABD3A2U1_9GENT
MESTDYSPPRLDASSRPSIGFPLGTAILLIIIFSISGILSCCYHWDKLQSFRRSFSGDTEPEEDTDRDTSNSKLSQSHMTLKQNQKQSLPVIMPGDQIPKFIAMPCPSQPPRLENIVVEVPKKPPKPPPIAIPLYL